MSRLFNKSKQKLSTKKKMLLQQPVPLQPAALSFTKLYNVFFLHSRYTVVAAYFTATLHLHFEA